MAYYKISNMNTKDITEEQRNKTGRHKSYIINNYVTFKQIEHPIKRQ